MKTTFKLTALVIGLVLAAFALATADQKPSFDVNVYGYFKLDGAYDQNETSHGNFVMWVNQQEYDDNDEQFNMTANETRLGINLKGKNYGNINVNAKIEFDLYASVTGGVAENKAMLQLRHAYFEVISGQFKLLAGQSWDIVSPLNPSTLNYPVLWGVGNIGYRRPQVSMWYTMPAGSGTNVTVAGGFFRTIGSNLTPTFSLALGEETEGADDGTDAGIPTFQGMLDIKHESSDWSIRTGVSGLWGELKAETNMGNSETYNSWGVNGHLMISSNSGYGLAGEVYSGSNLGSYFGGILNNSTVDGVNSFGGWGSAWFTPIPKVKFSGGVGVDDPDDKDLGNNTRSKNTAYFGNIRYSLVPNVTLGLEVSFWETDYKMSADVTESYDDVRVQTSFIFNY
nr:hypothetical protein [candidate division Zixibacteria bacterium]